MRLESERLLLRRLEMRDAPAVQELASHPEVAATTLNIPHPYPEGAAEQWIRRTHDNMAEGRGYTFGVERRADGHLLGACGIYQNPAHQTGEIGYWIGYDYWGQGYATEAARRVIRFGFEVLGLNRIFAMYFTHNPASRRVMEKCGMSYEGTLRQHLYKWGEFKDVGCCAILLEEWVQSSQSP